MANGRRPIYRLKRFQVGIALLVLGIAVAIATQAPEAFAAVHEWLGGLGTWAGPLYMLAAGAALALFFPAYVAFAAAGAVFGLGWGTLWSYAAACIAAFAAFALTRGALRGWAERRIGRVGWLTRLDREVGSQALRIAILLRLSPMMPLALLSYAFGLTAISVRQYVLSLVGLLPSVFSSVYVGYVARGLIAGRERAPWQWAALIGGLVATMAAVLLVGRAAWRALRQVPGAGRDEDAGHEPAGDRAGPSTAPAAGPHERTPGHHQAL